jgi:hypothetical protein
MTSRTLPQCPEGPNVDFSHETPSHCQYLTRRTVSGPGIDGEMGHGFAACSREEVAAVYHMMHVLLTTMLVVGYSTLGVDASHAAGEFSGSVRAALYRRLHLAGIPAMRTGGDTQLQAGDLLARFYAQRAYEPAWIHQDGALPGVEILLTVLSTADRDGLRPQDYHLTQLEARFQEVRQTQTPQTLWALHRLVDLELLCTEVFLQYGSHARSGRLHPKQVEQVWSLERDDAAFDLATLLPGKGASEGR